MRLKDKIKIYEVFEGLEIEHFIGDADIDVYDQRESLWTADDNNTLFYFDSIINYGETKSNVIRNNNTGDLLILHDWMSIGLEMLIILNSTNFVPDITFLQDNV